MSIIRKCWLVIVLSLFITLILHSSQFYFIFFSGHYKGLLLVTTPDELAYLTRINRAHYGDFQLGSVYDRSYRKLPYVIPPFFEAIIGWISSRLHIPPHYAMLLSTLLGLFFLAITLYHLIYILTTDKWLSTFCWFGILCLTYFFLNFYSTLNYSILKTFLVTPHNFINHVSRFFKEYIASWTSILFIRPISPQLHLLFSAIYMLCLYHLLQDKRGRVVTLLASAFCLSIVMYTSPFFTPIVSAFNLSLIILCFIQKDLKSIKYIVVVSILALLLSLPSIFHHIKLFSHPDYSDALHRLGLSKQSKLFFNSDFIFLLFSAVILLIFRKKYKSLQFKFIFAIHLSYFFIFHQHILTGYEFQPFHYTQYFFAPFYFGLSLFLLIKFCTGFFKERSNYKVILSVSGITIIGLITAVYLYFYTLRVMRGAFYPQFSELERKHSSADYFNTYYTPVVDYLKKENRSKVILANPQLSDIIAAYTQHYTVVSIYSNAYLVPQKRFYHNYFLYVYLKGVGGDESTIASYFSRNFREVEFLVYSHFAHPDWTSQFQFHIVSYYQKFLENDFQKNLLLSGVNYIIQDTYRDRWIDLSNYSFLRKKINLNGIIIYEVTSTIE